MKHPNQASHPARAGLMPAAIALFTLLAALWLGLPLLDWLGALRHWVQDAGNAGPVAFIALYTAAVIVFAPATLFTLAAGAIWGWAGVPISLAGAWLGSMGAFALARSAFGRHCHWLCEHYPGAEKLNQVIDRLGWRGVLLSRLSPLVPFSLQNYLFGMTRVNAHTFAWAGLIGMLPATGVKVWAGAAGTGALSVNWPTIALLGAGVLATLAGAMLFARHWQQT